MRSLVAILLLCFGAGLARADSAADLAAAKAAFQNVQAVMTAEINRLDDGSRTAIWARYYRALENLQKMDVHLQMMTRHGQDRAVQFDRARVEFSHALDELNRLLQEKPAPE